MLHYLKTDIQTRFDLGIQETPNGEHPLPLLFLHTETKEGKRMMRHWITQPLSDLAAIQARLALRRTKPLYGGSSPN